MSVSYINEEIALDSNTYSVIDSISAIQFSNQFTMIFDLHSSDWTKPFGYQLLGNYTTDGFGIFNLNTITPTLFINSASSIQITNLNFEQLDTVETTAPLKAIIRLDDLNFFYTIQSDGIFSKYNNNTTLIYTVYHPVLENLYDYDYDNTDCYVLGYNADNATTELIKIDLLTGSIDTIDTTISTYYNFYFYSASALDNSSTVNFKNDSFYFTKGDKAERYLDTIYFRAASGTGFGIYSWNIANNATTSNAVSLVLSAYNSLEDYDLDLDGNLWALYDYTSYVRINSNRIVTLSGSLPLSGCISTNIDFGLNLKDNELQQFALISAIAPSNKNITYKLDGSGNLISVYYAKNTGVNNTSITQSSYLRYYYSDLFLGNNLNFKLKLTDLAGAPSNESLNLNYSLSSLAQGYHNFVARFNADSGSFHFIVDGKIVIDKQVTPKKYKFSNLFYRPLFIGTACYNGNIPLSQYLNDTSFNCRGIKIKNFYLYDRALNYFDILFHNKQYQQIEDIVFDLPGSNRNYLEEIERYFKFRTPGNKSSIINIVLKNTGINNQQLRSELEKRINRLLAKAAPAYTKVKQFKWSN